LQKKDYKNAFRQMKALDKVMQEDGVRVYQLANTAENDQDYDAAIEGYSYIVSTKGVKNTFYLDAKQRMLACKRKKLTNGYAFTINELRILEQEYETFLIELGRYNGTAQIMMELADLEALYLNDIEKAIKILEEVIDLPMLQPQRQAKAKLSLGDFYLIKGENWEATLLYSQVDKAFKDDATGHEARFRNAKLAYYKGDFAWAKTQFGVLKASTSKLIANDAIDMDVFITDNMGLDSNTTALEMYANAELLMFQNRFKDAFAIMDSILTMYPQHSLDDDVLYLKAKIHTKKREYEKAIENYMLILKNHSEEIRADNALFEMAELYEIPLKNKEKAKELYEKLFNEFSGSTLAVEARKKYRLLRGDKVPQ
jgi:tetratricopeptide (TPR) repeat protein